ncbi:MAG TPA: hypothetical protein VHL58_08705 [Thermoanaerobaculia bacterium]|nr:hypothetical protein [Thermoanaerobaculia bacterium]
MPRLVWFVLKDGRSLIAACDSVTNERLAEALATTSILTLTGDDSVEVLRTAEIREFVSFDVAMNVPQRAAIFNFVQFAN